MILRKLIFIFVGAGLWACSSHLVVNGNSNKEAVSQTIIADSSLESMIKPYKDSLDKRMNEVLAIAEVDFIVQRPASNLMNWVANALFVNQTKTVRLSQPVVCLLNTGGIRSSIGKGNVTLGDLYKVQRGGVDNGYGTPEGGVFGLYDKNGKEIIPVQYEDIAQIGYESTNGYIIKRNGKYGICSPTGKILMEPQYTEMNCESELCIVSRYIEQSEQTKMGLVNHNALKEIVPTIYEHIESLSYEGDYLFKLNNKYGLMSKTGTITLPANYNFLKATDLYDNDQWVLANAYGEVTQSYYGSEVTGGNWGVINKKGALNGHNLSTTTFFQIKMGLKLPYQLYPFLTQTRLVSLQ